MIVIYASLVNRWSEVALAAQEKEKPCTWIKMHGFKAVAQFHDYTSIHTLYTLKQVISYSIHASNMINNTEPTESLSIAVKSAGRDLTATDFFAHPMHRKHMKPHQVKGFNFLCSNLMVDNPCGYILAHASGSGNTFLIISFILSYLARLLHWTIEET